MILLGAPIAKGKGFVWMRISQQLSIKQVSEEPVTYPIT